MTGGTTKGGPVLRRPADLALEVGSGGGSRPRRTLRWPDGFVGAADDRSAMVVLLALASLTPRRLLELAQEVPSAAGCLAAVRSGRAGSAGDRALADSIDPGTVAERIKAVGARVVLVGDPEYPSALLDLFDPPAGLFVVGRELPELEPRVAVVGARRCSAGGRDVASELASALAAGGACVVSGGALGIDAAAHAGALAAGGGTIAVLGCGLDVPYPRTNASLLASIRERGALLSEYPPGTPAEPFRFPARNRIVAALSMAVLVVEGAAGSGSMITVDHAMELGRDVLAVPGSVTNPLSWVPNSLIRDGAGLIREADDLLSDLGLVSADGRGGPERGGGPGSMPGGLSVPERAVWSAITGPSPPDALARSAGLPVAETMAALVGLELRGLVRQVGGRFERRVQPRSPGRHGRLEDAGKEPPGGWA